MEPPFADELLVMLLASRVVGLAVLVVGEVG